jgi:hypothetical protein
MIRASSIFSQMLQLFSRTEFERAVVEHRAERHARGFSCWGQFVAMLFCHLGRAQSLREICGGLAASEGKLRHLGLPDAPKRSTLAYANEHRPWPLYRSVFNQLLGRCREVAGSHGFRFKNKLLTLDATLIALCASVFDWAQYRRTKGAVKLHLLLDHQGLLPSFALITEGRVHESRVARSLRFEPGTIVVFDRGYADYDWFASLDADGVFFVTRIRDNAAYGVVERRSVPEHGAVRRDEIIFPYKAARTGHYDLFLRGQPVVRSPEVNPTKRRSTLLSPPCAPDCDGLCYLLDNSLRRRERHSIRTGFWDSGSQLQCRPSIGDALQ